MTDEQDHPDEFPGDSITVPREALHQFLVEVLKSKSLFAFDAKVVSDSVLDAEMAGASESGFDLLERLLDLVERGDVDPRGRPLILEDLPAVLLVDGSSAAGHVGVREATKKLAEKVSEQGAGVAIVKGGREVGHPALAMRPLADAGLVGICATTTLRGENLDSLHTSVGAAIPSSSGPVQYLVSDDAEMFTVLVTALAGGHAPEAKAASANPAVAEHLIVAIDPERTTTLTTITRALDGFSNAGTLQLENKQSIVLSAKRRSFLKNLGTLANLDPAWESIDQGA